MTTKTKDVIERAVKTFVQAFLALFVPQIIAYLNGYTSDLSVKTVLYPALAAGISAVWNLLKPSKSAQPQDADKDNNDSVDWDNYPNSIEGGDWP